MALKNQLQADLMESMKAKDEVRTSVLRMVKAAIMKFEVSGDRKEATDADILNIINKEIKSRKDSVEQFTGGNRMDLADKEAAEIKVLEAYMPPQMSEDEVKQVVLEVMNETGATSKADIGKVMGPVMAKVKGLADGGMVNKIVGSLLK
ncbi:GatB/YqeY domain-containing protein [Candidatus Peregrinibacteria bacterium]|nr:GatB/YqeY domain-containing protein [Candidatus Peregrinibacteria bacterium]